MPTCRYKGFGQLYSLSQKTFDYQPSETQNEAAIASFKEWATAQEQALEKRDPALFSRFTLDANIEVNPFRKVLRVVKAPTGSALQKGGFIKAVNGTPVSELLKVPITNIRQISDRYLSGSKDLQMTLDLTRNGEDQSVTTKLTKAVDLGLILENTAKRR